MWPGTDDRGGGGVMSMSMREYGSRRQLVSPVLMNLREQVAMAVERVFPELVYLQQFLLESDIQV